MLDSSQEPLTATQKYSLNLKRFYRNDGTLGENFQKNRVDYEVNFSSLFVSLRHLSKSLCEVLFHCIVCFLVMLTFMFSRPSVNIPSIIYIMRKL